MTGFGFYVVNRSYSSHLVLMCIFSCLFARVDSPPISLFMIVYQSSHVCLLELKIYQPPWLKYVSN